CEVVDDGVTDDHCVLVTFPFEGTDLAPVFDLEEALEDAIMESGTGEFDGNEVGGGEVVLYMYGPDADALYTAIAPVLTASHVAEKGVITLRYGSPADNAREVQKPVRNDR